MEDLIKHDSKDTSNNSQYRLHIIPLGAFPYHIQLEALYVLPREVSPFPEMQQFDYRVLDGFLELLHQQ